MTPQTNAPPPEWAAQFGVGDDVAIDGKVYAAQGKWGLAGVRLSAGTRRLGFY